MTRHVGPLPGLMYTSTKEIHVPCLPSLTLKSERPLYLKGALTRKVGLFTIFSNSY